MSWGMQVTQLSRVVCFLAIREETLEVAGADAQEGSVAAAVVRLNDICITSCLLPCTAERKSQRKVLVIVQKGFTCGVKLLVYAAYVTSVYFSLVFFCTCLNLHC